MMKVEVLMGEDARSHQLEDSEMKGPRGAAGLRKALRVVDSGVRLTRCSYQYVNEQVT
jgi:hypothetical protein